jgi:hypothetical protein
MARRLMLRAKVQQMKNAVAILLVFGTVSVVGAHGRDILASFEGGIGVTPISSFAAPVNQDGTFQNVTRNVVRGVKSSTQLWRIADLKADITTDGRVKVRGRGCCWPAETASGRMPI